MQFYLLLALSGVISGSTVLAQAVTGYDIARCSGTATFTYTATCTPKCFDTTNTNTKSLYVPEGVGCALYEQTGCVGTSQNFDNPSCAAVDLQSVGSYVCVRIQGC